MARILVADCSDPEFSAALAKVLVLKGFGTVETVCDGVDAVWERVVAAPPDLVLLDQKTAPEILAKLRAAPRARAIRVLVVASERAIDGALPGVDGYIQSPAPPHAYVQAVRSALEV